MCKIKIQILKKANQTQIESLASIHYEVLKESFLCKFGYGFLVNLYKALCSDKNNIIHIIILNKKIIGYSVATKDISKFYKGTLYANLFGLSLETIRNLHRNLKLVYNILIWFLTSKNNDQHPAELQFLAIFPQYQRQGLGTKLIILLKNEYLKKNITSFKVGTKADNFYSNSFYKKSGFKYLYQKSIVGEKINYYLLESNKKFN